MTVVRNGFRLEGRTIEKTPHGLQNMTRRSHMRIFTIIQVVGTNRI
jgi:hypothetical protein